MASIHRCRPLSTAPLLFFLFLCAAIERSGASELVLDVVQDCIEQHGVFVCELSPSPDLLHAFPSSGALPAGSIEVRGSGSDEGPRLSLGGRTDAELVTAGGSMMLVEVC